jgi:hypothetical protein
MSEVKLNNGDILEKGTNIDTASFDYSIDRAADEAQFVSATG